MGRTQLHQKLKELGLSSKDQFILPTGSYQMISNQLNKIDPAAVEQWVEDHYLTAEDWVIDLVEEYLAEKRAENWDWVSGSVPAGATRAKASRKPWDKRSHTGGR